jgi:hypothetical protein
VYRPDADELATLSRQLTSHGSSPEFATGQDLLARADARPAETERWLEHFAWKIRHAWLTAAANKTAASFRSPRARDVPLTPRGKEHDFGYERELCPEELEQRCHRFFEPAPAGTFCEHVLFSSGQAAMLACLLADGTADEIVHLGGYFETPELARLARPAPAPGAQRTRTVIAEPVWFDGQRWGRTDIAAICAQQPAKVIVDATLSGLHYEIGALVSALPSARIMRLHSALKLFQSGLELADAGIVTVFDRTADGAQRAADALRHIRALCGLGLRFAEIAALELPAFLDRQMTWDYEQAIFTHNARLARVVAKNNRLFHTEIHPVLGEGGADAPYCTLRLATDSDAAYERLEQRIQDAVAEQDILLECGGSFGFRGHRYEIVRPAAARPFLRVAMGRRAGRSLEKSIALFESLAGQPAL